MTTNFAAAQINGRIETLSYDDESETLNDAISRAWNLDGEEDDRLESSIMMSEESESAAYNSLRKHLANN